MLRSSMIMKKLLAYTLCCMLCVTQNVDTCYGGLFSKKPEPTIELVKENWGKQKQLGTSSIAQNLQDLMEEFISSYSPVGGLKVDKALSNFLKGRGLKRAQIKTLTTIVINGKLNNGTGGTVDAANIELDEFSNASTGAQIQSDDDDSNDDDQPKKKTKKKVKKDKKSKKKKQATTFDAVKANWEKQTEQGLDGIPDKLQEAMNSFISEYQDDGSPIGQALASYLDEQGLNRAQKKRLTSIVLKGKIVTGDEGEEDTPKKKKKKKVKVENDDAEDGSDVSSDDSGKKKKKVVKNKKKRKANCKPTLGSIRQNWKKQQEMGVDSLPDESKEAMDQFVRQYADVVKLLNDFLTEKGLDKEQKKQLTAIVLNGQFVRDN